MPTHRLRILIWLGLLIGQSLFSVTVESRAAGWADQRSNHTLICRANFSLAGYEPLLGELGQVQNGLHELLQIEPPKEPIELYLFKDKRSYQQYLQQRFPQVPDRRALFIKGAGPGKVFVYRSDELPIDVRHESTHALLHATLPLVPLWLDEGLAEYFEVPPKERTNRKKYLSELRRNLLIGRAPRLEVLESRRDLNQMSAADYRDAWAWVHFMLHGPPEARQELIAYLADIQAGTPPGYLSQRLAARLPNLDKRLAQHLKTWQPPVETAERAQSTASK